MRTISGDCAIAAAVVAGDRVVIAMGHDIDQPVRDKALSLFRQVEPSFREIGLTITADTVVEGNRLSRTGTAVRRLVGAYELGAGH